ncbi:uncharacterized protein O3C94_002386 [Discoglossus pictus]
MDTGNQTSVTEFTLSGLSHSFGFNVSFTALFLVLYLMTLSGNFLIINAVRVDQRLHSPMYFFLSNLSFLDICYSTVTVPKMLINVLSEKKTITFNQCMCQLFFLHFFGGTECFLLTVMAYDRYVAICNPLRYHIVMSHWFCLWLVLITWIAGFVHSFTQALLTYQLPFCGPNKINHFFCDVHPLSVLACSDTAFIDIFIIANSGMISLTCFLVLLFSYLGIITTILKIRSAEGRRKAFSTCASHLLVVTILFGPCVFIYLRPPVNYAADKMVSMLYTILTPLLNPIIYTMRNQEMKNAMKKLVGKVAPHEPTNGDVKEQQLYKIKGEICNSTEVTEFIFVGFTFSPSVQHIIFLIFTLIYSLLLSGNILIMITIKADPRLHSPMYFFLGKLSFIDLCYSSVTVPKMLVDLLSERKSISFNGCITQLYFFHFFACAECFIFTAMAYDRYVAICKPLHYSTIMSKQLCLSMVVATWLIGFVHSNIQTILTMGLPFCGPNEINSFFCDIPPLIRLACTDTTMIDAMIVANSGIVSLGCFLAVLISYVGITSAILKIKTVEGRSKAFSTCASHLTVVTIFFGPCVYIYMRPSTTFSTDQVVIVFYTVIAPMLNPIIYTLRNEEVKTSMKKVWRKKIVFRRDSE